MFLLLFIGTIFASTFLPTATVHANPDCSAGKTVTIVAHEDDDLLFINPKIQEDIDAGKCVETIFVTAGGSAANPTHWQSREAGMGAAYATMAGQSSVTSAQSITISGHTATYYSVVNQPKVSLLFLRLPDGVAGGNESLKKLWLGQISSEQPVDSTASYTKQDLIDVLHARMTAYQPNVIRTQDYTLEFGGTDHIDHTGAAYFARAAHNNYTQPHQFIGYKDYGIENLTQNVTGSALTAKQNAYFAYDPYDGGNCSSVLVCDPGRQVFLDYMKRNYEARTETRTTSTFQTLEGTSTSVSQVNNDIGQNPATIVYNSALYTFYVDKTNNDLRYAKALSSTNPQWTFGTLDSTGDVGFNPSVVAYNNQLHVFYYRNDTGDLRHATFNGTSWSYETLDGNSSAISGYTSDVGESSTAVVYGSSLQLFYYDKTYGNLRHAWFSNNSWSFENLEGDTGSISHFDANIGLNPTALIHDGSLQLYYYDQTNGNLRHTWENNGWHFENLDGDSTSGGRLNTNLGQNPTVSSYDGSLQIFYYDETSKNLRHAWADSNGWHFENLEGDTGSVTRYSGDVGLMPWSTAQGSTLHVFAYDLNGSLRHYWSTAQGWNVERMDGFGDDGSAGRITANVGENPVAISFDSKLHIFYYDVTGGNLRYATQ